jgi:hypothetical protein
MPKGWKFKDKTKINKKCHIQYFYNLGIFWTIIFYVQNALSSSLAILEVPKGTVLLPVTFRIFF